VTRGSWPWGVLLTLATLFAGCKKKDDPAVAVRTFFAQIAAGKTADAHAEAAFGFRVQLSANGFAAKVRDMDLLDNTACVVQAPQRSGPALKLPVEVTTHAGEKIPFIVTVTDEAGAWRVHSVRSPQSTATGVSANHFTIIGIPKAFSDLQTQPIPDEPTVQRMIETELGEFNRAIETKSFTAFYDHVSHKWKERLSEKKLQREFQPFIDRNVKLSGIEGLTPKLYWTPSINSEGLLVISGEYASRPYRVAFELQYYYELPNWKLFGIEVDLLKWK
jgi:hypothetical protein